MKLIFLACLLFAGPAKEQQASNPHTEVSFFANAPIGKIHAVNEEAFSSINLNTGEIIVRAQNKGFQFPQKFMERKFNQDIMESLKYPYSEFKGKITEKEELKQEGQHRVYVDGILTLHGISKAYHTYAWINVQGDTIHTSANFKVKSTDHHIKIPTLLAVKFAEQLDIHISGVYLLHKS